MKQWRSLVCGIFIIAMMSGCSMFDNSGSNITTSFYDDEGNVTKTVVEKGANNSDVDSWTDASAAFKVSDDLRIVGMAEKMYGQDDACADGDNACRAYATALKDISLGFGPNFRNQEFTLVKPLSGYDVINTGVKVGGDVLMSTLPIVVVADMAKTVVQDSLGSTTLTTAEGDINVSDSLNRTETHATSLDGSTSGVDTATSRDETTVLDNADL